MGRTYKDIDCVADIGSTLFTEYAKLSQATISGPKEKKYGLYWIYYGAALLFVLILKKIFFVLSDQRSRKNNSNTLLNTPIISKLTALSRYVAYKRFPLMFSRITGLPSSFGTLFVILGSTLFTLCYAFIPREWYRDCAGFGSPLLSNRTGMMCMGMLPYLCLMSGKTNFISGMTGVSYEKLNIFHQFLGFGSLFFSIVHTIPFLVQDVKEGGWERLHEKFAEDKAYRTGVAPLVILFCLFLASTKYIRKRIYELFWHCHWIMGLSYFGALTYHIYDVVNLELYIWSIISFWGAQILYRIVIKSPFKPNTHTFRHKEAVVKCLPNGLFEVTVPIESKFEFFWRPGQHIFIRFMRGIRTLDNHPFSVLTVPKPSGACTLKLVVRPQGGLTRKIYDDLLCEENLVKKYKVYLDGAYGGMNRDALAFDKLVLVASGTGVSVIFPFMLHVAQNLNDPTNRVKYTDFIWITNSIDSLEWIKDQLIELLNLVVETDQELLSIFNFNIFVTNSGNGQRSTFVKSRSELARAIFDFSPSEFDVRAPPKKQFSSESSSTDSSLMGSKETLVYKIDETNYRDYLNIYLGKKPDLRSYIAETSLLKKNAVIVSGTAALQNSVGNGVSHLQRKVLARKSEVEEVYLHTETFGF